MKRIHRNLFFTAVTAGIISFTSCKENKETSTEAGHGYMQMSQDAGMSETSEVSGSKAEFSDKSIAKNYSAYLELKNALVATDAEAANVAAQKLAKSENTEIAALATTISEEGDVEAQRKTFSKLTASIEPVLANAIASGEIYKQFCPMAFQGKGDYWFSDSEEIKNPYFGNKMLHCGRVEKTIK